MCSVLQQNDRLHRELFKTFSTLLLVCRIAAQMHTHKKFVRENVSLMVCKLESIE